MPSNSPPYSYDRYDGNGSTTQFAITFDYLSQTHLSVSVGGVVQTTGFTIDNSTPAVNFTTAPGNGLVVLIKRTTPKGKAEFQTDIADFTDGSILKASDLDQATLGLLYISQEAQDAGASLALPLDLSDDKWDGQSKVIKNVASPSNEHDVATKAYVDTASYGSDNPAYLTVYSFSGNGSTTQFQMSDPTPSNTDAKGYIVEVSGVAQRPNIDYTISSNPLGAIVFTSAPAGGSNNITARNIGIQRDYLSQPVVKESPGDSDAALRVKDVAGSSGNQNLQEWQNSSGTPVANMDTTGDLSVNRLDSSTYLTVGNRAVIGATSGLGSMSSGDLKALGKVEAGTNHTSATDVSLTVNKLSTFDGKATLNEGFDAGSTSLTESQFGTSGNYNKLGDSRIEANKKLYGDTGSQLLVPGCVSQVQYFQTNSVYESGNLQGLNHTMNQGVNPQTDVNILRTMQGDPLSDSNGSWSPVKCANNTNVKVLITPHRDNSLIKIDLTLTIETSESGVGFALYREVSGDSLAATGLYNESGPGHSGTQILVNERVDYNGSIYFWMMASSWFIRESPAYDIGGQLPYTIFPHTYHFTYYDTGYYGAQGGSSGDAIEYYLIARNKESFEYTLNRGKLTGNEADDVAGGAEDDVSYGITSISATEIIQ